MIDETIEMTKLINTFGYASVALAVIFVLFLAVIVYIIFQNKQLMQNIMIDNKSTVTELKEAIRDLANRIQENTDINKKAMADVVMEVESLKVKYLEVSQQIFETIYDEKSMSDTAWYDYVKMLVITSVYKSILDIIADADTNGFDNPKRVELFKESICRILDRRKNEAKAQIQSLNYDTRKQDYFDTAFEQTYARMVLDMKTDLITQIDTPSLSADKNYLRLKTLVKNRLFEYLDEVVRVTKDISRGV